MIIVTNTASSYTPEEGERIGLKILPVGVSVNNGTYRDYIDISSEEFLDLLGKGETPHSSQPAVGDVMDIFNDDSQDIIMITVADGLSGEYQTAMGMRQEYPNKDRIYVVNSRSLAGPLRYLANKALKLREEGLSADRIAGELERSAGTSLSYVIPADFDYLQRSGRISKLTSKIGGALKLHPVLTQSDDRRSIVPLAVKRSYTSAVKVIINHLASFEPDENHLITIAHGGVYALAVRVQNMIRETYPGAETEVLELAPSLITHGGPGCVVVQIIRK